MSAVIASGRLNSIINSVPEGSTAERFLAQPMRHRESSAHCSADQQTFAAASQAADQHSAAGAETNLGQVLAIVAVTLELAFGVDIGSVAQIGVHHGGVQHVALAVGQDYRLGKNSDGRLARNAPRFVDLGDPSLHRGADGDYGLSIEHHRVHHPPGEGIAFLAGES